MREAAAQALVATTAFVRPATELTEAARLGLTDEPVEFWMGRHPARSVIRRPLIDESEGPPAKRALARLLAHDQLLADILIAEAKHDARLQGWDERIVPPPVEEIPADLLSQLPSFDDPRLLSVS